MAKVEKAKAHKLPTEHWKEQPDDHDYPAAGDYLSLLMGADLVQVAVSALEGAPLTHRKAKDLLRASRLELLPADNEHVASDLEKVRRGKLLSPVLLLRGDAARRCRGHRRRRLSPDLRQLPHRRERRHPLSHR